MAENRNLTSDYDKHFTKVQHHVPHLAVSNPVTQEREARRVLEPFVLAFRPAHCYKLVTNWLATFFVACGSIGSTADFMERFLIARRCPLSAIVPRLETVKIHHSFGLFTAHARSLFSKYNPQKVRSKCSTASG